MTSEYIDSTVAINPNQQPMIDVYYQEYQPVSKNESLEEIQKAEIRKRDAAYIKKWQEDARTLGLRERSVDYIVDYIWRRENGISDTEEMEIASLNRALHDIETGNVLNFDETMEFIDKLRKLI